MIEFPEDIQERVRELRERYKAQKHCVLMNFPIIEVVKYYRENGNFKEVSFKLFYEEGVFEMQAPDQKFQSRISHFDYRSSERRWVRRKDVLFATIEDLKQCGLWDLVANKDLVIVNMANPKTNHRQLLKLLRGTLSDG